jgi:hypothetical protein
MAREVFISSKAIENLKSLPVYTTFIRTITPAEAVTLFSAPITLVAAPGVRAYIDILDFTLIREPGDAFTIGSAGNLQLRRGTTNIASLSPASVFYGSTITASHRILIQNTPVGIPLGLDIVAFWGTDWLNLPITLGMLTADMTTAGTGNSIVKLRYRIVTLED